jgi:hypothetical protein
MMMMSGQQQHYHHYYGGKKAGGKKGKGGGHHYYPHRPRPRQPKPRPPKPVFRPTQPLPTALPQTSSPSTSPPVAVVPEPTGTPSLQPSLLTSAPSSGPVLVDTSTPTLAPSFQPSASPAEGTALPTAPEATSQPSVVPSPGITLSPSSSTPVGETLQPSSTAPIAGAPTLLPSSIPSVVSPVEPTTPEPATAAPSVSSPVTLGPTTPSPSPLPTTSSSPTLLEPDLPQTCTSPDECPGGACGYEIFDPSSNIVCCPSNETVTVGSDTETQWCTGQDDGSGCGKNAMCTSGVCVQKVCQEGLGAIGDPCDSNNDCENQACGFEFFRPNSDLTCCRSNETEAIGSADYCTGQQAGDPCGSDSMCENGLCADGVCQGRALGPGERCDPDAVDECANDACGREIFEDDSEFICCPSNEAVQIDGIDETEWCTGQPNGASCGSSEMCQSQLCLLGICTPGSIPTTSPPVPQTIPPVPLTIPPAALPPALPDPTTPAPVPQTIPPLPMTIPPGTLPPALPDPTAQPTPPSCPPGDDSACENGACGLQEFGSSSWVCCPSAETLVLSDGLAYCSGLKENQACGNLDELCAGELVCILGLCSSRKQGDGENCSPGDDVDCQSGACGLEEFGIVPDNWICCASGETLVLSDGRPYCTERGEFQGCDNSDEICAGELVCILGLCTDIRQDAGQSCAPGDNNDCKNNACGLEEFGSTNWICCPSGTTLGVIVDNNELVAHCTEVPDGGSCGSFSQLCASFSCVGGTCQPMMTQNRVRSFPWALENVNEIFHHDRL